MNRLNNPYLDIVVKDDLLRKFMSHTERDKLVREYAWSVPTDEAIDAIVKLGPIVEAGAGTGYWASLISEAGGDIVCYDIAPPGVKENYYKHTKQYYPIHEGGEDKMSLHSDRSLLLCWPPYGKDMGLKHISNHNGPHLILVGESEGGCCGNDEMFEYINKHYSFKEDIYIPQWFGINDYVSIYSRKN